MDSHICFSRLCHCCEDKRRVKSSLVLQATLSAHAGVYLRREVSFFSFIHRCSVGSCGLGAPSGVIGQFGSRNLSTLGQTFVRAGSKLVLFISLSLVPRTVSNPVDAQANID